MALSEGTDLLAIPPDDGDDPNAWHNCGHALLETFGKGEVNPAVLAYAGMGYAWRANQPESFAHIVGLYGASLGKHFPKQVEKARIETVFNAAQPFYAGMWMYLGGLPLRGAFVDQMARAGPALGLRPRGARLDHRHARASRPACGSRAGPPVTNLYSSALFIGWGSVALCLVLEAPYRNAIGSAAAGLIGFATLIIAHHLALAGDTLEMMRAVLDSNFWLGTHVVVVTTGYASTFLAGFLAVIYILRGVFTTNPRQGDGGRAGAHGLRDRLLRDPLQLCRDDPRAASGPTSPGAGSGAGTRRRTGP